MPIDSNLPPVDPSLLITGEGVSADIKTLGKATAETAGARGAAGTEGGYLTTTEYEILKTTVTVKLANPELSAPDKEALSNWLKVLDSYPKRAPYDINAPALSNIEASQNPYLDGGIMAIVWKILSELGPIMASIIMQSSKLQVAMMELTKAMAKEAFELAIAAGQVKAEKLQAEANMHMTQAICAGVSIAMIAIEFGATSARYKKAGDEYNKKLTNQDIDANGAPIKGSSLQERYEQTGKDFQTAANAKPFDKTTYDTAKVNYDRTKTQYDSAKASYDKDTQEIGQMSTRAGQIINHIGTIMQESTQAGFKGGVLKNLEIEQSELEALKEQLTQLMNLLQTTLQSAEKDRDAAVQMWSKLLQSAEQMGEAVTRAFHA